MFFDIDFAIKSFPIIMQGVPVTLLIAVVSLLLGLVIGFLITLCRIYKIPFLKQVAVIYVSFIRGTPILVQIYIIYYSLPLLIELLGSKIGWSISTNNISPLLLALVAFTINAAAYLSETIRSALMSVDAGQMEAVHSVGMTTFQGMVRIIIPQALVVAMPNIGNLFLSLLKDTSLAFTIMVVEVLAQAKISAASGYRYLEAYTDAALIYWIMCFSFERIFILIEKRLKRYRNS